MDWPEPSDPLAGHRRRRRGDKYQESDGEDEERFSDVSAGATNKTAGAKAKFSQPEPPNKGDSLGVLGRGFWGWRMGVPRPKQPRVGLEKDEQKDAEEYEERRPAEEESSRRQREKKFWSKYDLEEEDLRVWVE